MSACIRSSMSAAACSRNRVVVETPLPALRKDSFLNSIGEGEGDQIVMWKRKAEVFLIDLCRLGNERDRPTGAPGRPKGL